MVWSETGARGSIHTKEDSFLESTCQWRRGGEKKGHDSGWLPKKGVKYETDKARKQGPLITTQECSRKNNNLLSKSDAAYLHLKKEERIYADVDPGKWKKHQMISKQPKTSVGFLNMLPCPPGAGMLWILFLSVSFFHTQPKEGQKTLSVDSRQRKTSHPWQFD